MKSMCIAGLMLMVWVSLPAGGAILQVPSEYASIQEAIDASSHGDTVIVAPGLYYERINFNGKNIVVTSTDPNDSRVVGYTVLNADGEGSVVTFDNNETKDAVLTGFTITGGTGTLSEGSSDWYKNYYGGGIYCRRGRPTITRNVITNNVVPYLREIREVTENGYTYEQWFYEWSDGGGIYASWGATITHNVIYNNSAENGGGIYASGDATIENNIIYDNSAVVGGGVRVVYGRLVNNTIVGNDAGLEPDNGVGGNVFAGFPYDSVGLTVANNIITGARSGGGVYWAGALADAMRFNDVWGNEPADYVTEDLRTREMLWGGAADWTGKHGNISKDPVFLAGWNERWHLDPESPCVSAGDPNLVFEPGQTDIDGDPRVLAMRVDIGADERLGYVKPLANAGDDHHILTPAPVTLDGTGSYFSDPEGMKGFQWSQTAGTPVELDNPGSSEPTFTPPAEGWYKFDLVVSDSSHASGPDTVLVVVGNEAPVAQAGPDKLWPNPGRISLDGAGSSDADPPDELTYTWTQVEGPPVSLDARISARPHFVCQEAGIYEFELVVSDGFVSSEPDVVKIEAAPFTVDAEPFEATNWDRGWFYNPALAGTAVVATQDAGDYRNRQIFWMDTKTGESRVFDAGSVENRPAIEGDFIVWGAGSGYYFEPTRTSVYLADLVSGEEIVLDRAAGNTSSGYPAISGDKVVWLRHRNVNVDDLAGYNRRPYDICGADISDPANPVPFTIAEDVGEGIPYTHNDYYRNHVGYVDICGDIVVWEGDGDIFGADISDLENITVFPICTAAERQSDPSISGNLVVWTDERDDIGDIYGADISDPQHIREFEVYAGMGWQCQADVDGPFIVFCDGSDSGGQIWVRCVSREYGLVDVYIPAFMYGAGPDIDGGTITWNRNEQISGVRLAFGYSVTNGVIENATTGRRYDYIQHAISSAEDGEVVLVPEGVYHEKLRFGGKNITVTSADPTDPAVRANTVLAGGGQLVAFDAGETGDCLFTGFTVTGGSFGLFCNDSSPTISHCNVTGNRDAGIKLWGGSDPTVSRCDITANRIGVEMWTNVISRSSVRNDGTIERCLITGNRQYGIFGGNPNVVNCTVADNSLHGLSSFSPIVTNSIIYFNNGGGENLVGQKTLTVTYSDIQGGASGDGNIDADPYFVARGSWTEMGDWTPGDYHLKSAGWSWDAFQAAWAWDDVTSPCIDAGDPTQLLGEEAPCEAGGPLSERAVNSRINMGAYGGTAEASLAPRD